MYFHTVRFFVFRVVKPIRASEKAEKNESPFHLYVTTALESAENSKSRFNLAQRTIRFKLLFAHFN